MNLTIVWLLMCMFCLEISLCSIYKKKNFRFDFFKTFLAQKPRDENMYIYVTGEHKDIKVIV